jgi:hypothetical protein
MTPCNWIYHSEAWPPNVEFGDDGRGRGYWIVKP